jgi:hypothetical protein
LLLLAAGVALFGFVVMVFQEAVEVLGAFKPIKR